MNLCIPGPTRCPPEVLEACSKAMINHRGPDFKRLLEHVTGKFKEVCGTRNDVLFLTSSGTGAMEAAVVNFLSPEDEVLVVRNGYFGERFLNIAKSHRAYIAGELRAARGLAIDPAELDNSLQILKNVKAVLLTHNETSTGVTNDLESLARVVKKHGKLLIVDAMSSLGAIPVKVDEWGLDVVISASQKAFMCPPGVAMIVVSPDAWKAHGEARMPRYYFDLSVAKNSFVQGMTSWTPAVSVFYGLNVALNLMLAEGMENIFERHRVLAERLRGALDFLGLKILSKKERASNTVTVFKVPPAVNEDEWVKKLADCGTTVGRGTGEMLGHVLRLGHMGWIDKKYIDELSSAISSTYYRLKVGGDQI